MSKLNISLVMLVSLFAFVAYVRAAEAANETFWQLADDADLKVSINPWPAQQGAAAKVHASIGQNDNDQKFTGKLEYRIVATEKSTAAWTAMKPVKAKEKGDVDFEVPATLPKAAKVWIQFRVTQGGKPTELTDWSIDLTP
jgi:hypothetical protein